MVLSKRQSVKTIVIAMVCVVAFASFWPACGNFGSSAQAAVMEMTAGAADTPCRHHMTASDCAELANGCPAAEPDKAAQFANPVLQPLAVALTSGYHDHLNMYQMRRAVAVPLRIPPTPPPLLQSPVALKTLFRN